MTLTLLHEGAFVRSQGRMEGIYLKNLGINLKSSFMIGILFMESHTISSQGVSDLQQKVHARNRNLYGPLLRNLLICKVLGIEISECGNQKITCSKRGGSLKGWGLIHPTIRAKTPYCHSELLLEAAE